MRLSTRLWAEAIGTALLLYVIVGSGIAVERLGSDGAAQILAHAVAIGAGLAALIAMLAPVSGAHFNPAVTLGFWRTGDIAAGEAGLYVVAQIVGAIGGVALANLSFGLTAASVATAERSEPGMVLAEGVVTFVLVLLILALVRTGRTAAIPASVGAWVAAIVIATVSTGFANPAVTIARTLTDTFTGIVPAHAPAFVAAQLLGGFAAAALAVVFFPTPRAAEPGT